MLSLCAWFRWTSVKLLYPERGSVREGEPYVDWMERLGCITDTKSVTLGLYFLVPMFPHFQSGSGGALGGDPSHPSSKSLTNDTVMSQFTTRGIYLVCMEGSILWSPDAKSWLIRKDPNAGEDWGQGEEGTAEDKMVWWHHWLNGYEFEQASGVGDGQGSLVYCSPWGCKESDLIEWLNNNVGVHWHRAPKALGIWATKVCIIVLLRWLLGSP